jgi:hypothetical protein
LGLFIARLFVLAAERFPSLGVPSRARSVYSQIAEIDSAITGAAASNDPPLQKLRSAREALRYAEDFFDRRAEGMLAGHDLERIVAEDPTAKKDLEMSVAKYFGGAPPGRPPTRLDPKTRTVLIQALASAVQAGVHDHRKPTRGSRKGGWPKRGKGEKRRDAVVAGLGETARLLRTKARSVALSTFRDAATPVLEEIDGISREDIRELLSRLRRFYVLRAGLERDSFIEQLRLAEQTGTECAIRGALSIPPWPEEVVDLATRALSVVRCVERWRSTVEGTTELYFQAEMMDPDEAPWVPVERTFLAHEDLWFFLRARYEREPLRDRPLTTEMVFEG